MRETKKTIETSMCLSIFLLSFYSWIKFFINEGESITSKNQIEIEVMHGRDTTIHACYCLESKGEWSERRREIYSLCCSWLRVVLKWLKNSLFPPLFFERESKESECLQVSQDLLSCLDLFFTWSNRLDFTDITTSEYDDLFPFSRSRFWSVSSFCIQA